MFRRKPPVLPERWRVRLDDVGPHPMRADAATGALYLGDAWGKSYAALRLHRLDLATGTETAVVRTRHQGVGALALHDGVLYAATDSRLFELRPDDLTVLRDWSEGLVGHAHTLLPAAGRLLMANWHKPSVGVFDPATGRTQRVKVGAQPHVLAYRGEVVAFAGAAGGRWRLDVERRRLVDEAPAPPLWSVVAAGDELWGVRAGRPDEHGTRGPTDRLVRLTGDEAEVRLAAEVAVRPAAGGDTMWCIAGKDRPRVLQRVSTARAAVVGTYAAGESVALRHVDVAAGVAFGTADAGRDHSELVCYELPSD